MKDKRCPKCSGKMFVDPNYSEEEYCIICGYVRYTDTVVNSGLRDGNGELRERVIKEAVLVH